MSQCIECGTPVASGESFCGTCGTPQPPAAAGPDRVDETGGKSLKTNISLPELEPSLQSSGADLSTGAPLREGEVFIEDEVVPEKRTTGGQRPAPKQLHPGTLLNSRYEIVRRIGGGGMGAVY